MKTAMKILSALAAVIGIIYVVATYGDRFVRWAKNLLKSCPCSDCEVIEEDFVAAEPAAEEAAPVEETPAEEAPEAEEAEAEVVVENNEPVAEEKDFAE